MKDTRIQTLMDIYEEYILIDNVNKSQRFLNILNKYDNNKMYGKEEVIRAMDLNTYLLLKEQEITKEDLEIIIINSQIELEEIEERRNSIKNSKQKTNNKHCRNKRYEKLVLKRKMRNKLIDEFKYTSKKHLLRLPSHDYKPTLNGNPIKFSDITKENKKFVKINISDSYADKQTRYFRTWYEQPTIKKMIKKSNVKKSRKQAKEQIKFGYDEYLLEN